MRSSDSGQTRCCCKLGVLFLGVLLTGALLFGPTLGPLTFLETPNDALKIRIPCEEDPLAAARLEAVMDFLAMDVEPLALCNHLQGEEACPKLALRCCTCTPPNEHGSGEGLYEGYYPLCRAPYDHVNLGRVDDFTCVL